MALEKGKSRTVEVTEVDGRRVEFALSASDKTGPVGRGTRTRFMVDSERFMAKANKKLDQGLLT